jgi:gliding motility-associated-like protein
MVTAYPVPVAGFSPSPDLTTILSPTITITDGTAGPAVLYVWDFGDGYTISGAPNTNIPNGTNDGLTIGTFDNPIHTYADTGTFEITLTVTNSFGCSDVITYTVRIEGDYIFFAPSGFTPNGDGVNDMFFPVGIGIDPSNYELLIFNRWGELIFESHNPALGWDGTYKNEMSKQDVYVWKVKTVDHTNKQHEYYGHVTLLR